VHVQYRNFFVIAFFAGLRFGEQSALKWKNVDFKLGIIKVRETRVRGEEGRPKTKRSVRDVTMLPPVVEAMRVQRKYTMGKSEYVFLNQYCRPVLPDSMNQHIWKTTLTKAKLADRRMYETRHTFATLMLDAGELPGWVQRMMGHETLQNESKCLVYLDGPEFQPGEDRQGIYCNILNSFGDTTVSTMFLH
jgi:integrase